MNPQDLNIEYRFSRFRVDVRQRRLLTEDGEVLPISSRAFDTLLELLEHQGQTLSKGQLLARVWPNSIVEENNLNQAISSLRRALGETRSENRFIATIPGRGYCFVAPVERMLSPADDVAVARVETAEVTSGQHPVSPELVSSHLSSSRPGVRWMAPAAFFALAVVAVLLLVLADVFPPAEEAAGTRPALSDSASAALPPTASPIRNSIAVLPFSNMNPDADNELFALGLHDELINQLTKIRSLSVISRSSVVGLASPDLPISELARVLRVESVMSGTILFAGEQARVSLQLLDPATGLSLWAGTYEANTHDLTDMIAVQSDIALNVATALEAEIRQSERERIASIPTASFEAYRYNLAARNAYYRQDFIPAWNLTKQAIGLDPDYYDAFLTFSSVNTVLVATPLPGLSSRAHFQLALESADRLIELDPDNSVGYALKVVALATDKEWEQAAALIGKLDAMDASLADLHYIALVLLCIGDFDRAIEIYDANLLTEPMNFFGRGFLMTALELAGERERSRQEYALGEELNPRWWGDTVNVFLALGRDEPLRDIGDIVGISPELRTLLSEHGDEERVRAGLRAFAASEQKISAEAVYYAALASYIGEHEMSVQFMRDALQDVWTSLYWFWLPVFDETRRLESFRQLLRDSGIVDYWKQHGWPEVCQPEGDDFVCNWQAYPAD